MEKERKTNFELLKIISVMMIISFHYVYKSGYLIEPMNLNTLLVKSFWFLGELGVNLFILITGYFMINKGISIKKILLIIIEVFFYNFINVYLNYYFLKVPIKLDDIMFPVITSKYWFITVYVIIYLLSPFINKFVKSMSNIEFKSLILVLMIWSVIPTIFGLKYNSTETMLYYSRLIWLIIMYLIGSYIRLYDIKILDTKKKAFSVAIVDFGIMLGTIFLIYSFKEVFHQIGTKEYAYLWTPNNVFMLILSVSFFQFFAKMNMKSVRIINILASTSLGIYMLHDGIFNGYLWKNIFKTRVMLANPYSIAYVILATIIIFGVGVIIDLIRQLLEKYTIKKILELDHIEKYIKKFDNCE